MRELAPIAFPVTALFAAALAAATPALAAEAQSAPPELAPTLTLTAEGHSTRAPDLAVFTAGVSSTGSSAREAIAANAEAMTRVIAALKAAAIEPRDIQTSTLSLNPVYAQRAANQPDDAPPRIVGYTAVNNVSVRQRNLGGFGKVIDTLVSAGATQVNGPSFELDNPDSALDEARQDAVAKARARADLYARAAGLKVVRITAIREGSQNDGSYITVTARRTTSTIQDTPVEAGEQQVSAQVTINFELAPQ